MRTELPEEIEPSGSDVDRRRFLTWSGAGLGSLFVGACAKTAKSTVPIIQRVCGSGPQASSSRLWTSGELRRAFAALDCLTTAALRRRPLSTAVEREIQARSWALHNQLSARTFSRPLAEAWRTFYGLTARLHEARNERARGARLPVYAYNGHHHAARLWIDESVRRGKLGPLLHFDTHADMRNLLQAGAIQAATKRLSGSRTDRRKGLAALRRLIFDHATPVSAGVAGGVVDDIVWATPAWSQTADFFERPFLYAELPMENHPPAYSLIYDEGADRQGPLPYGRVEPWLYTGGLTPKQLRGLRMARAIQMSFVRSAPARPGLLPALAALIPASGFILDIDLDYFLSIDHDSGFRRRPRRVVDRTTQLEHYEAQLRRARSLLDQRLGAFESLLGDLRRRGRVPKMVTIADSTFRPFSITDAGQGFWEYMPYEFAAYTHWRLRRLLGRVYARDGVAAGA